MSRALGRRGVRTLATATAILAGAAGVALATIPGAGGVISGCYEKNIGILRVIDTDAGKTCTKFEKPISWNQKGVQGEKGPMGLQGLQGPQGEQGEPGPASLAALVGTTCTRADGSAGTVGTSVGAGDVITIRCEGSGGGGEEIQPLIVTPALLDFGNVAVGTVSPQFVTISNPNDAPVTVTLATTNPAFWVASDVSVPQSGTIDIEVSFVPSDEGVANGDLTLTFGPGAVVVSLTGTGV